MRTADQTQSTLGNEAAYGLARGRVRDMSVVPQPPNRKVELPFAREAAMPQKMGIDHALAKIQAQARHEIILELFPDECSIGFFVFHGLGSKEELIVHSPDRVGIFD
jgi:hypothetical protein